MFHSHQPVDDNNFESGGFEQGFKRSRKNATSAKSRSRQSTANQRSRRKRSSGSQIQGMAHRRQRKWSW